MDKKETINELMKALSLNQNKPGMYIGKKSIVRLRAFIDGFLFAMSIFNDKKECIEFHAGFNEWISKEYKIDTLHDWSQIILFLVGDDSLAFDKFFDLYDKYLCQRPKKN